MTSRFQVAAKDTELLGVSHLAEEMKTYADEVELFPVLIDRQIAYFHKIDGGYHRQEGYHVINLIHTVQGSESPPNKIYDETIEAHIGDRYFFLEVEDVWEMKGAYGGDDPVQKAGTYDDNYILSLKVTGYRDGPYAFSEELQSSEVDKRETEYEYSE